MPDKKKPVGIWIRVSTEEQAQGESPEHHEHRARAYAEAKDWQVVTVYDLAGVSGKTVAEHPETLRMREDVESGRVEALIFSKLARLARNTRELLDLSDYFREQKADLVSLDEAIDTSTPAGRLFYTVVAAMAQWEREEISERVKKSVKVRAELGKPLGGAAPFGYTWDDGELVPDPDEAPVRRRMYELFADCQRVKTVAGLLNEAGHRTRRGARFTATTVRRLLEDPTAKGLRRANWTESQGDGKAWETKPEEEWVWSRVEPIVPEELWDRCNAVLAVRRKKWASRPSKRVRHLFAGLVFCADCDRKMYVTSGSKKYVCEGCRRKIPTEDLERVFIHELRGIVFSPESVLEHLEAADQELTGKRALLETLRRERESVLAESEKLYRLYLEEEITSQGFGRKNKPLEERLGQLDEEIPRLQAEIDFLSVSRLSREEIISEARDLYSRWDDLDFEARRSIVENLVEEILVGEDELEITLREPPSFLGTPTKGERNSRGSSPRPARSAPGTAAAPGCGRRRRSLPPSVGEGPPGCRAGTRGARRGTARRSGRG